MRKYVVQPGDSPAKIATTHAGCPKCAIDLVRANKHKPAKALPNGFATFHDLHVGETLNLPDKWFDGRLDDRPRAYFAALPNADGVTASTLGGAAAGVLADYVTLDNASDRVAHIVTLNDAEFDADVDTTAAIIDTSIDEALTNIGPAGTYARAVLASTSLAKQRHPELTAAIAAGDQNAGFLARDAIVHNFSDALVAARKSLQAFYGDPPAPPPIVTPVQPPIVTPVYAPPHPPVIVHAPAPPVSAPPVLQPAPQLIPPSSGASSSMFGVTVLGAGVVGGVIYLAINPPKDLRRTLKRALRKRR